MSELHQERDRLPRKLVSIVVAAGVFATVVGVLVAWLIARAESLPMPGASKQDVRENVSGIELRNFDDEPAATQQWRRDGERLSSYGWVDRSQGTVHIPIDEAIDLYLTARPGSSGAPERTAERPEEQPQ